MKLSEAIRLGSMLKPQGFGQLFKGVGSCALGAAYEAAGCVSFREFNEETVKWDLVAETFPILFQLTGCPACNSLGTVNSEASHLNDDHRWTREQIAEWVASREAVTEPETVAAVREAVDEPVVSIRA